MHACINACKWCVPVNASARCAFSHTECEKNESMVVVRPRFQPQHTFCDSDGFHGALGGGGRRCQHTCMRLASSFRSDPTQVLCTHTSSGCLGSGRRTTPLSTRLPHLFSASECLGCVCHTPSVPSVPSITRRCSHEVMVQVGPWFQPQHTAFSLASKHRAVEDEFRHSVHVCLTILCFLNLNLTPTLNVSSPVTV